MRGRTLLMIVVLGMALPPAAAGQAPIADPRDVATIDGVMAAFYEVISGPAGTPRQWGRDSTLYMPGVRLVALAERNGRPSAAIMDHDTYIRQSDPGFVRRGFFEREVQRVVRRFGNLAHVFSSYETLSSPEGPVTARGVNSVQLYWDGTRWWITNVVWDSERPTNPLPPDLDRTPPL